MLKYNADRAVLFIENRLKQQIGKGSIMDNNQNEQQFQTNEQTQLLQPENQYQQNQYQQNQYQQNQYQQNQYQQNQYQQNQYQQNQYQQNQYQQNQYQQN